ncbi:MAG TPA: alpha-(1-_3)-arabinofuranosyltransferase family protein [Acidimicrobiales bacterium]|nr:alpha-(1->3)-arabinofuranosyltransferase family protein [Acidimicrobiales bacterium]
MPPPPAVAARPGAGRRHLPHWAPVGLLAAVCYLPLLLTHRGQVGADTKSYLYLDPDRLLGRAWSMWDPNVGLGTVPHQNIGYLWPMGPFYWASEHLGLPDWVAQRLWLGSILFGAGLGVRYLLRALGQSGPGVTVAMFLYALSPYVLTLGARISALLLPFAALGWLLGLTVRAVRQRDWLHPALFALAVPTVGSSNATALLLVGLAPALWVPYATFVLKEVRLRAALGVVGRMGVLTVATSLWWVVGLWCQGGFGIDVLRYTETARTVADASTAPELLRGLGYWYFYGDDKLGQWIEPSSAYTENPALILLTYGLPVLGLLAAGLVRWRYRGFFVGLVVLGLAVAVGAHPWDDPTVAGSGVKAFLQSQAGLAMRSLPRTVPLIALGLSVATGMAVTAVGRWRPRWERPSATALVALALVGLPPLWLGQMVADNLQRDEELPAYWTEAAAAIDGRGRDGDGWESRVLEVPGSDFAAYRWGNTVDPITPGLVDRPYVARELIPYGTPASADLLNALDHQMQEAVLDPEAIAPIARLMGAGDIVLRGDLAYERFNLVRPRQAYDLLERAPGLGPAQGFGPAVPNVPDPRLPLEDELELGADPDLPDPPPVALYPVEGDPHLLAAKPVSSTVVVAGNGDGLVAAAAAGLIDGDELIRYSASFAAEGGGGAAALRRALADGGALVVTDTNRRSGQRWGSVHETDGFTEQAGEEPMVVDPSDNRLPLFPGAGSATETVAVQGGELSVRATSYGNSVTFTPEDRAAQAFDDDPLTGWYTSAFASARGERLEATYASPRTTDSVRLLQAGRGIQNRWITRVRLRFDGGDPVDVDLNFASRAAPGQEIPFPRRTFRELSVEILATEPGQLPAYDELSGVGFSDIRLGHGDVRIDESVRPPLDLLTALGDDALDHPLALVLTRLRSRSSAPLRTDEEPGMVRDLELPGARAFALAGTARLSAAATDSLIDLLLGRPTVAEGGVEPASSRRLPGDVSAQAAAAVDGDPGTHWSPGFLGQDGEWAGYRLAEPVTFDHMDLRVVADGRHTVPTRLRIEADGETAATVDVPAIADRPGKDATTEVRLTFPEVTGRDISIHVVDSREVETNDWISKEPVVMPVGIAEWGIPGLRVDPLPEAFDSGCRDDLLTLDGDPVPVRITGTTRAALDGEALDLAACDGAPLDLPAGPSQLRTAEGVDTGLQIDRLALRSAAGGEADTATTPLVEDPAPVTTTVIDRDRWRVTADVGPRAEPTWLVVGQSHNEGWRATLDGEDLGPPQLVDGYSSGFLLPPGADPATVEVVWAPQRVVLGGLWLSLLAALGCLVLVLRPWRWRRWWAARRAPTPAPTPATATDPGPDERPLPLDLAWALRSPGTAPSWPVTGATTVALGLAGAVLAGAPAGLLLAVVTLAGLRSDRARPLLALGPAAVLAGAAAYVAVRQVGYRFPAGFRWPEQSQGAHGLVYAGVLLLVVEVVVRRLRTRRGDAGP